MKCEGFNKVEFYREGGNEPDDFSVSISNIGVVRVGEYSVAIGREIEIGSTSMGVIIGEKGVEKIRIWNDIEVEVLNSSSKEKYTPFDVPYETDMEFRGFRRSAFADEGNIRDLEGFSVAVANRGIVEVGNYSIAIGREVKIGHRSIGILIDPNFNIYKVIIDEEVEIEYIK